MLPSLLDSFRGSRDEAVGQALVSAMIHSPNPAGSMAGARMEELLKDFSPLVRSAAAPLEAQLLLEKNSWLDRLRELEPLLSAGGDVGRGRNVFFGEKAACGSCHTIGTTGGHVGPDLTSIGAVRSGLDILEAIVFPSASFVPGFEIYRVTTAKEVYTGVRAVGESGDAVVLISGPREIIRIPRKEMVSMSPSPVSLMPDGFDKNLNRQELVDLLAFLQGQKSRVEVARNSE